MTWLGTFLIVAAVIVVLGLAVAALLDRRARAQGRELHPLPVRERIRRRSQPRPSGRRRRSDDRLERGL